MLNFHRYGVRSVERLARHGLLGPRTVTAHARCVDGHEARVLAERGALVAWCPLRDLLSEGHGFEALWIPEHRVALGTSGLGSLPQQWDAALAMGHRAGRLGRLWAEELVPGLLLGGAADLVGDLYGAKAGHLAAGGLADLVLLEPCSPPRTPGRLTSRRERGPGQRGVDGGGGAGGAARRPALLGADALELEREAVAVRRARR